MSPAASTQAWKPRAARSPAWPNSPPSSAPILRKWFDLISATRRTSADPHFVTVQPLGEARGEVDIGGAYVEFFADEAEAVLWRNHSDAAGRTRGCLGSASRVASAAAITPWIFRVRAHPQPPDTRKKPPPPPPQTTPPPPPPAGLAGAAAAARVLKPANDTPLTACLLVARAEKSQAAEGGVQLLTRQFSRSQGSVRTSARALRRLTGSTKSANADQQAASG